MRTIIKSFIVILITVFVISCDIERLPYDQILIDNPDESTAETMTLGTYSKLKEEYFYKSTHYVNEYGGDNVSLSGTTTDKLYYLYKYQRLVDNYYPGNVWKFTYQMIININYVIESLPEGKSKEIDQILGENYYLRGYLYFTLGNIFGRPYTQNPETNLSIPIKLTSDKTEYPPRATVKEVYNQVIKDLEKGASLMTVQKNSCYASKEVAYALLSRVNLYMENWTKSKQYADLVINSNRYQLLQGDAYGRYSTYVPESNTETIFAIRMVKDKDYEDYHMASYSVGSLYAKIDGHGWGEMYPSESYLRLLHQNPTDLRHSFIKDKLLPGEKNWLIYVLDDEAKKSYVFVTNEVKQEGGNYTIVEKPEMYTSPVVQSETVNGTKQYYVTRKDNGKKYDVRIEPMVEKRNGYPMRYIYKCSLQEEQAQLYSPVILRLAEMYLNRAEANYHLGNIAGAIDDINIIRERARIPKWDKTSLPANKDVLDLILDERRLELAFETHRRLDIYRNRKTLDRRYPGGHLSGASSTVHLTIEHTSPIIVEFIPEAEMDAYPIELIQNP